MKINKHISGALALNSSLGRSITFFMTALLLAGVAASTWTLTRSWDRAVEDMERNAINLSVSQARQAEDTFYRPNWHCAIYAVPYRQIISQH
jgi:hypothetical protein